MGIKIFETRDKLSKKLKLRGLRFNKSQLEKVLIEYNYFELFNGIESLLLNSSNPKEYRSVGLRDFLNIYKFDKAFNSEILVLLNYVEERLKSSVAYHFSKAYCSSLNDTMQYTNKCNYMNPSDTDSTSSTFCSFSHAYPFKNDQNYWIFRDFNRFELFKPNYLEKLVEKYDYIDISFYQDSSYIAPSTVIKHTTSPTVAVPLWVAIETLEFGKLIRFLHYLKMSELKEVMADFGMPYSKRVEFLNMLDFLLCLRNSCAHNSLVQRFRTPNKYKISGLLVRVFDLNPIHTGNNNSGLKLFDTLKFLGFFTNISILKRHLVRILILNMFSMGLSKGRKTNRLLLKRMGCENFDEWKKVLSGKRYNL